MVHQAGFDTLTITFLSKDGCSQTATVGSARARGGQSWFLVWVSVKILLFARSLQCVFYFSLVGWDVVDVKKRLS